MFNVKRVSERIKKQPFKFCMKYAKILDPQIQSFD